MVETVQLTQTVVCHNRSFSVVTEPVFLWKFYADATSKVYIDKRSKLKGTFIGERFIETGSAVQFSPKLHAKEAGPAIWNDWFLLFILIVIVMLRRLSTRKYNQLLMCLSGNTNLNVMLREWNPMKNFISFLVVFVYVSGFSLLVQNTIGFMSSYSGSNSDAFLLFIEVFGALTLLLILKFFVVRFLSFLFKTRDETAKYLTNQLGFFSVGGLALLPLLFILIYNPSIFVVFFSFGIIFILQIIKIVRSFVSGLMQPPFSVLFLFVYLCTLEIIPLVLITKTILMLSNGSSWE